jgi:hypothetical protein
MPLFQPFQFHYDDHYYARAYDDHYYARAYVGSCWSLLHRFRASGRAVHLVY